MLRRFIFGKKTSPIKLGRWAKCPDVQENIKSTWSNSDHCGDLICGKPESVKNIIGKDLAIDNSKHLYLKHNKN